MFKDKCKECSHFMDAEKKDWLKIYEIMEKFERHPLKVSKEILFGDPDFDDYDEIMFAKGIYLHFFFLIFIFLLKGVLSSMKDAYINEISDDEEEYLSKEITK